MKSKFWMISVIMVFVSLLSMPVFAFNSEEGGLMGPSVASPLPPQSPAPNVFGTNTNILQIPASSFVVRGSGTMAYGSIGYAYPTSAVMLWAPVTLPAGANIRYLGLYFYDTNASGITAWLTGYSGGDFYGTSPGFIDIALVSSTGTGGYGYVYTDEFSHTVNNDVAFGSGYQYVINVNFPVADGTLRFKGVDLWWNRQISPAPGTATFSDVPLAHPFFQHIEALAASGITTGYGDGTYRPGDYVTRAAMAAYFARALGLHWEY